MAVFVAGSDETTNEDGRGDFFTGGFVAPELDWRDWFAPAWEERVLTGPPAIPYLHMVDIRKEKWRRAHGMNIHQAEARVSEAASIIGSMGSLYLVTSRIDAGHFKDVFGSTKLIRPRSAQPALDRFEPDHLGFLAFAHTVLRYVGKVHPNAEKVDFIVEKKQGVTKTMDYFYENLRPSLSALGHWDLARLVGDLIPAGKERVPLQAADVACWHIRQRAEGILNRTDARRYRIIGSRLGHSHSWSHEEIAAMAGRSKARQVPSPFKPKKKPLAS